MLSRERTDTQRLRIVYLLLLVFAITAAFASRAVRAQTAAANPTLPTFQAWNAAIVVLVVLIGASFVPMLRVLRMPGLALVWIFGEVPTMPMSITAQPIPGQLPIFPFDFTLAAICMLLVRMPAGLFASCMIGMTSLYVTTRTRVAEMKGLDSASLLTATGGIHLLIVSALLIAGAYLLETSERRAFLLRLLLDEERAKSESLLLNVLPEPIADRLKQSPGTIAEHFESATVLFADLVGFTPFSASHSANEVVDLLNRVFSRFDALVRERGLEKIKTVGDAYMVAGGLPVRRPDHLEAMADLALAMMEIGREMGIQLRIGLNTGPLVAGVIGTSKYLYDLWGATVNTASRMQTHCEPGQIQVTAEVAAMLGDRFEFRDHGLHTIKGLGEVHTYLLLGRRRH